MNTYYRNTRAFSRTVGIWIALLVSLCSQAQEMPYISGEFIVRLVPGSNLQDLQGELEGMWGSPVSFTSLSRSTHIHKLSVTSVVFDQADEGRSMLQDLQANDLLELAQFNHIVSERETVPNDPDFGVQWHHQETGDHDIDSDLAWDITTGGTTAAGDDIVVCVIEGGGTNYNHTDLVGNHWTNTGEIPANGIDDDENGYVDDYNGWNPGSDDDNIPAGGHGTSVSGMIGATGNNSQGGSGVNWAVKIMQVVVGTLTEANVIAAYDYPLSMRQLYNLTAGEKGAFVVATNASWGIDFANPVNYPVWCGFYDDLGAAGILNCGATTNNNVNVDALGDMPTACSSPYMVAVTATDVNDVRTFSGYGASTIDLGAPGESVYLPAGSTNYGYTSGTSFASPCVAGAIALMYSAPCSDFAAFAISTPQWTADQALSYLLNGVDPVANLATETVTGGRLNVRNSIDLLLANCGPPPTCTLDSLQAVALCTCDENTGAVVAAAELSLQFNFGFCEVSELCYTPAGGSEVCILVDAGVWNNMHNVYTLSGLLPSTDYTFTAHYGEASSAPVAFTTLACDLEIPGCTDAMALNYDPAATFDIGTCDYPCSPVVFTLSTDCWALETGLVVTDASGTVLLEVLGNSLTDLTTTSWELCLFDGCYTATLTDTFGDGMAGAIYASCGVNGAFDIAYTAGPAIDALQDPNFGVLTTFDFCVTFGEVPGCTDASACNYDAGANLDNGTCILIGDGCDDGNAATGNDEITGECLCAGLLLGCTDVAACNYDATAELDNGLCVFPGCTHPVADNYDPIAGCDDGNCTFSCSNYALNLTTDCWGEETSWQIEDASGLILYSSEGIEYADLTLTQTDICLNPGCYTFTIFDAFEDGMAGTLSGCASNGSYTFTDGNGDVVFEMLAADANFGAEESQLFCVPLASAIGCTDTEACNYLATALEDDGTCTYPGCIISFACNYDPQAGCDNGTCLFGSCDCFGDFDGDGWRLVNDMLQVIGDYGCVALCGPTDLNSDNSVDAADILLFLSVFGTPCP